MRVNDLPKYLLLLGCLFFLATAAAEETYQKRRGMGIEQWYIAVQKFGLQYGKKETQAATKQEYERFIEEFTKEFDQQRIKFRTRVKEVRWQEGVAHISTESTLPTQRAKQKSLSIDQTTSFDVKMTEEEAVAIKPGMLFDFDGALEFQPRNYSGLPQEQRLYSLTTNRFGSGFINVGTFTSTQYEIRINGKDYPGRWSKEKPESLR